MEQNILIKCNDKIISRTPIYIILRNIYANQCVQSDIRQNVFANIE